MLVESEYRISECRSFSIDGNARILVDALNGKAERIHVPIENNRGDYPAINGMQLKEMLLEDWRPPDRRKALIQELDARRAQSRARRRRSAA